VYQNLQLMSDDTIDVDALERDAIEEIPLRYPVGGIDAEEFSEDWYSADDAHSETPAARTKSTASNSAASPATFTNNQRGIYTTSSSGGGWSIVVTAPPTVRVAVDASNRFMCARRMAVKCT
jgi:hypothetical protein